MSSPNSATLPELRHLGPVADVTDVGSVALRAPEFRGNTEFEATGEAQTAMIEGYFAAASARVPEIGEAEGAVWDEVFAMQQADLAAAPDEKAKDAIALNILVGNALATYGMPEDQSKQLVAGRSWQLAQTREGGRIATAASENIGLCVVTGDAEAPYESIAQTLGLFGDLLTVTDKDYTGNTALPTGIVQTADRDQASWLLELGVAKGDMWGVGANLPDVNPEFRTEMARNLLSRGVRIHRSLLRADAPFSEVLPRDEVIDDALVHDPLALTGQSLVNESPERRDALVRAVLPHGVEGWEVSNWLGNVLKGELSPDVATDIVKIMGVRCTADMLKPFAQLPDGTLALMRTSDVRDWTSVKLIDKFSDNDQRAVLTLSDQGEGSWDYTIYEYPEAFRVISRDDLLKRARDTEHLGTVANYLGKWTDGSDQELLLEIMNSPKLIGALSVVNQIGNMPNLDKAWLLNELTERDDLRALARGAKQFGDLIDQRQFIADRIASSETSCLIDSLGGFDQIPERELYKLLTDAGLFDVITSNTLHFKEIGAQAIFNDLLDQPGGLEALSRRLAFFGDMDIRPLYTHLVEQDDESSRFTLAFHFDKFIKSGVDPTDVFSQISQSSVGVSAMIKKYHEVPELSAFISFDDLVQKAFDMKFDEALLDNVARLPAHLHDAIVDAAFEAGRGYQCATREGLQVDKRALGRRLCAEGYDMAAARNAEDIYGRNFSGMGFEDFLADGAEAVAIRYSHRFADYNEERAVTQLIDSQKVFVLKNNLRYLHGPLSNEAALLLVSNGFGVNILEQPQKFGPITAEVVLAALEADDITTVGLYEKCTNKVGWLDRGIDLLGKDAAPAMLYASQFISEDNPDPLPDDLQAVGVRSKGTQGIIELRALTGTLRTRILEEGADPARVTELGNFLIENRYAQGVAKRLVRFDQAEWGHRSKAAWQQMIEGHLATLENHAPLPEGFVKSEPIVVRQIDAKEFDPSKIDEDARNRYGALAEDVQAALEISRSDAPNRYDPLLARGQELLIAERTRLGSVREGLVARGNTKGLANIDGQLQSIDAVLNAKPEDFGTLMRSDFQILGNLKIKGLDRVVRTVAFARAFTKSERAREHGNKVAGQEASFDALTDMDGLVSYLMNNEVYHNYFTSDQARKSFAQLTDTTTLRAQVKKLQDGAATGRSTLTVVPTRGLLLEMLGHMADACWASKYPSIANEFPGITGLVFLRDEGTPNERFVGGSMLIDTVEEETGDGVLVMRGTNPIENYINRVKIDEFSESLLGYVKSIAGNRKVGAIFDNRHGKAATNRPLFHEHLTGAFREKHAQGGPLRLPANTTFNNYVLTPAGGEPVYVVS